MKIGVREDRMSNVNSDDSFVMGAAPVALAMGLHRL